MLKIYHLYNINDSCYHYNIKYFIIYKDKNKYYIEFYGPLYRKPLIHHHTTMLLINAQLDDKLINFLFELIMNNIISIKR